MGECSLIRLDSRSFVKFSLGLNFSSDVPFKCCSTYVWDGLEISLNKNLKGVCNILSGAILNKGKLNCTLGKHFISII